MINAKKKKKEISIREIEVHYLMSFHAQYIK